MRYLAIVILAAVTVLSVSPAHALQVVGGGKEVCIDPGDTELTQSTSLEIVPGSGVAYHDEDGFTSENTWSRSYTMDSDISITCVRFGIETNTGGADHPGFINIFLDTNGGTPDAPLGDLQLLGSASTLITAASPGTLIAGNFDPPIDVLAGQAIVVEFSVADGQISEPMTGIFPGANGFGQSGPSYLNSIDLADLGFPDSHLVNTINGYAGGKVPCPADLDGNGTVNTNDLLILFAQWGTAGSADFDGSGNVDTADLLILFANWGPCG